MNPPREHITQLVDLHDGLDWVWHCMRCGKTGRPNPVERSARNARAHELRQNRRLAIYLEHNDRAAS